MDLNDFSFTMDMMNAPKLNQNAHTTPFKLNHFDSVISQTFEKPQKNENPTEKTLRFANHADNLDDLFMELEIRRSRCFFTFAGGIER